MISLPITSGSFAVVGYTGEPMPAIKADDSGLKVNLTNQAQYLIPDQIDPKLKAAADWERMPLEMSVHGPAKVNVCAMNVNVGRSSDPIGVRITCPRKGAEAFAQSSQVSVTNPLRMTLEPTAGKNFSVRIDNPTGEAFAATLVRANSNGSAIAESAQPLRFDAGQLETTVQMAVQPPLAGHVPDPVVQLVQNGKTVSCGPARYLSGVCRIFCHRCFSRWPNRFLPHSRRRQPPGCRRNIRHCCAASGWSANVRHGLSQAHLRSGA